MEKLKNGTIIYAWVNKYSPGYNAPFRTTPLKMQLWGQGQDQ